VIFLVNLFKIFIQCNFLAFFFLDEIRVRKRLKVKSMHCLCRWFVSGLLFSCMTHFHCYSDSTDKDVVAIEIPEDFHIPHAKEKQIDVCMQAYMQAVLDMTFPNNKSLVTVQDGTLFLTHLPKQNTERDKLIAFAQDFIAKRSKPISHDGLKYSGSCGEWLPQSTILYPTELANPLQVAFSGAVRFRDKIAGQVCTPVSFGAQFPLYRWSNTRLFKRKGDLQVEVEGSVFAIFNQTTPSSPLINADYYVGIPLSFAYKRWAHRLRLYHVSSHLGDEYMNRHHHEKRLNKSFEAIDYSMSYNITKQIRLYVGPGVIFHSDSEMRLKPLYINYGMEVKVGKREWKQLYGTPYLAMHFSNYQDHDWDIDTNFAIGYEIGKLNGLGRKVRLALEYHNGFCYAGQFSRYRSDYLQAKLSWGF
jgi:hypothetical protein